MMSMKPKINIHRDDVLKLPSGTGVTEERDCERRTWFSAFIKCHTGGPTQR